MSRCPDCEYTDVRTVSDAHSTWMLTLPCERHAAAAPVLLPPVGVSATQAAQSLADALRADAARISVARFVYSRTLDHGGVLPGPAPPGRVAPAAPPVLPGMQVRMLAPMVLGCWAMAKGIAAGRNQRIGGKCQSISADRGARIIATPVASMSRLRMTHTRGAVNVFTYSRRRRN